MGKVQYKHKDGALHIGGGRFFYAQEPVEVASEELEGLLNAYDELEIVEVSDVEESDSPTHTAASLKKLNADEQKAIITGLGGDLESVNNEEERIALILQLQEEQKVEGE